MRDHDRIRGNSVLEEQATSRLLPETKSLLSLSFKDRDLEKVFRTYYLEKSLSRVRLSILFATFLYAMFGLLDEYIIFEVRQQSWIIRYAIFCPLAIGVYLLSFHKRFQRFLQPSLVILGFIAGVGITMMIALAEKPGSDLYYAGLLLCSMFYFVFLGLRFPIASGLSWAIFVVYEITAIWIKGLSTPILINNSFFFVAFNVTGMWACYSIERYTRSDFTQRRTILEQADKLRMIFQNSPVGILHFNHEGTITDCNPSLAEIMGSSKEKIIGLNIITDLNDARVIRAVKQALSGDVAHEKGEYISVTSSKNIVAKVDFAPIITRDGAVVGGVGIVEDITERHHAEEALRHSEQRYKSLYSMIRLMSDNVPDLIWAKDLEGKFIFVNRSICRELLNAKDTQEPIGKNDMFFAERERNLHPENPDWHTFGEVCVDSDTVVKTRLKPCRFEEFGNVKGEFLYLDVFKAPFWNEENVLIGTVGCGRVVTKQKQLEEEHKRAEDRLRESAERYRHLVENANDIIYATDANGRFTVVNRSGLQVSGYSEEEIIGKHYLDPILPKYRDEVEAVYNSQFVNRIPYTYHEFPIMTKQGQIRWLGQNTHLLTEGETVLGFQSISRDITELKKAQIALQENEAMLRVILSTSPVGIALTCNRIIKWANEAWMTMFGFDNEQDFIGKSTKILYPSEEEYERSGIVLFKEIEADKVNSADVRFRRKDGFIFDGYVRTRAIYPQNPSEGFISAVSDVSERKNAERAVLISERRLELALQGADLGWWDRDLITKQVTRNKRWAEMLGYSLVEIENEPIGWEKLVHPEDYRRVQDAFDEHLKGSTPSFESEYRLRTKGGAWRWVLDRGRVVERDQIGNPVRITGTLLDIDQRKKSELVQKRLATAVEQAVEGIMITDRAGNIEYVNPAFEVITGYSKDEAIGQNPRILQSGQHDRAFYRELWEMIGSGEAWKGQFINRKKDGTLYREDAVISPVKDPTGRIVNYVAVKRDKTVEIELQQQLFWAQKMEGIGTLAGGIAHDFNNLLQVVMGRAEVMLQRKKEGEADYAGIQQIYQAGKRGADLVKSLLTFSRKVEPKLCSLDLNQEVLQFQALISRTIPKTIKIDLHLNGDLELTQADPSQVGQILMNLAVNARDAMPNGGMLTIATDNVELDQGYCSRHLGAKMGRYVMLAVSDSGHGMDKETLSHIFEPFFTTKEADKGTGLGLATVYGIVKQHQGYIVCYSEPGVGTSFKIYLPAVRSEKELESPITEMKLSGGTETILLVDDDDSVLDLTREFLESHGYRIVTAINGKEALEIYRSCGDTISLTILDLIMPDMDGKQCSIEILRMNPHAKVLIASGYFESSPANGAMAVGAKGFLDKPYNMRKLLSSIREVLDES